jgi:hypothetical protein
MIGAYFSGSGATIRSGAAGLGEYFDAAQGAAAPPPVSSFQDGVFGGGSADVWMSEVGDDPGPLRSFKDGSLGACHGCGMGAYDQAAAGLGYPLWIDGKPVDRPVSIMHAPTPMGAESPMSAFRDGSLGEYFGGEAPRAGAYRDGSLGEYFSDNAPWAGAYRDGVLGAVSIPGMGSVLDLTDPATLTEFKSALGLATPEVALDPKNTAYTQDWYTSPIWDPAAEALWSAFVQKAVAFSKGAYKASALTASTKHPYPTGVGALATLALGVASPAFGSDPTYFPKNFPILAAWQKSAMPSPESAKVKEPFFTTQEKVSGKSMFAGMSKTSLVVGVGLMAAVGAFLVFRKK